MLIVQFIAPSQAVSAMELDCISANSERDDYNSPMAQYFSGPHIQKLRNKIARGAQKKKQEKGISLLENKAVRLVEEKLPFTKKLPTDEELLQKMPLDPRPLVLGSKIDFTPWELYNIKCQQRFEAIPLQKKDEQAQPLVTVSVAEPRELSPENQKTLQEISKELSRAYNLAKNSDAEELHKILGNQVFTLWNSGACFEALDLFEQSLQPECGGTSLKCLESVKFPQFLQKQTELLDKSSEIYSKTITLISSWYEVKAVQTADVREKKVFEGLSRAWQKKLSSKKQEVVAPNNLLQDMTIQPYTLATLIKSTDIPRLKKQCIGQLCSALEKTNSPFSPAAIINLYEAVCAIEDETDKKQLLTAVEKATIDDVCHDILVLQTPLLDQLLPSKSYADMLTAMADRRGMSIDGLAFWRAKMKQASTFEQQQKVNAQFMAHLGLNEILKSYHVVGYTNQYVRGKNILNDTAESYPKAYCDIMRIAMKEYGEEVEDTLLTTAYSAARNFLAGGNEEDRQDLKKYIQTICYNQHTIRLLPGQRDTFVALCDEINATSSKPTNIATELEKMPDGVQKKLVKALYAYDMNNSTGMHQELAPLIAVKNRWALLIAAYAELYKKEPAPKKAFDYLLQVSTQLNGKHDDATSMQKQFACVALDAEPINTLYPTARFVRAILVNFFDSDHADKVIPIQHTQDSLLTFLSATAGAQNFLNNNPDALWPAANLFLITLKNIVEKKELHKAKDLMACSAPLTAVRSWMLESFAQPPALWKNLSQKLFIIQKTDQGQLWSFYAQQFIQNLDDFLKNDSYCKTVSTWPGGIPPIIDQLPSLHGSLKLLYLHSADPVRAQRLLAFPQYKEALTISKKQCPLAMALHVCTARSLNLVAENLSMLPKDAYLSASRSSDEPLLCLIATTKGDFWKKYMKKEHPFDLAYITRAQQLINEKKYQPARTVIAKINQESRYSSFANFYGADCHLALGNIDQAIDCFDKAFVALIDNLYAPVYTVRPDIQKEFFERMNNVILNPQPDAGIVATNQQKSRLAVIRGLYELLHPQKTHQIVADQYIERAIELTKEYAIIDLLDHMRSCPRALSSRDPLIYALKKLDRIKPESFATILMLRKLRALAHKTDQLKTVAPEIDKLLQSYSFNSPSVMADIGRHGCLATFNPQQQEYIMHEDSFCQAINEASKYLAMSQDDLDQACTLLEQAVKNCTDFNICLSILQFTDMFALTQKIIRDQTAPKKERLRLLDIYISVYKQWLASAAGVEHEAVNFDLKVMRQQREQIAGIVAAEQ